jgi:hypothetical protein
MRLIPCSKHPAAAAAAAILNYEHGKTVYDVCASGRQGALVETPKAQRVDNVFALECSGGKMEVHHIHNVGVLYVTPTCGARYDRFQNELVAILGQHHGHLAKPCLNDASFHARLWNLPVLANRPVTRVVRKATDICTYDRYANNRLFIHDGVYASRRNTLDVEGCMTWHAHSYITSVEEGEKAPDNYNSLYYGKFALAIDIWDELPPVGSTADAQLAETAALTMPFNPLVRTECLILKGNLLEFGVGHTVEFRTHDSYVSLGALDVENNAQLVVQPGSRVMLSDPMETMLFAQHKKCGVCDRALSGECGAAVHAGSTYGYVLFCKICFGNVLCVKESKYTEFSGFTLHAWTSPVPNEKLGTLVYSRESIFWEATVYSQDGAPKRIYILNPIHVPPFDSTLCNNSYLRAALPRDAYVVGPERVLSMVNLT